MTADEELARRILAGDDDAKAELGARLAAFWQRQAAKLDAWIGDARQWLADNPEQPR